MTLFPGRQKPSGRHIQPSRHGRLAPIPLLFTTLFLLLAAACRPVALEPTLPAAVPESVPPATATATAEPALQAAPSPTAPPTPIPATPIPTAVPVEPLASPSPTMPPGQASATYQVIFVAADDVLNVRTGPGVANPVAGALAPDAADIVVTGPGEQVAGSLWVPVTAGPVSGWVNRQFLTESVEADAFCSDPAALALLETFQTAVANRDGEALARLVHPERGLRIHRHWWNPEVRLTPAEVSAVFTGNQSYYWGVADGTGDEMRGPFSRYILPLLDRNLLPATETGCNEILHGSTAGLVQLPEGYEAANFVSLYRPAEEGVIEFDWGAWVVGVERREGDYYLTFLVHFEWEI
jgi:hypothetical protein